MDLTSKEFQFSMTTLVPLPLQKIQSNIPEHIDIRYHFIREHVMNGTIELHFVPTHEQLADIFTKALDEGTFSKLVAELGMVNFKC